MQLRGSALIEHETSQLVMDLVPEAKFGRIIRHENQLEAMETPEFNVKDKGFVTTRDQLE